MHFVKATLVVGMVVGMVYSGEAWSLGSCKIRPTESGTVQITISRCFLSFKTIFKSKNPIFFRIKLSLPK